MEEIPAPTTLDLHGFTVQEAYQVARRFLNDREGTVTVITGRSGEICKEFPTWAALHPNVRTCSQMNGGGAFLIKLR
jgi:DNA-nicking Smr family endonuclease